MNDYYLEVGTSDYKEELSQAVHDLYHKDGLPIEISEVCREPNYLVSFIYANLKGKNVRNELTVKIVQYYIAHALGSVVLQGWEERFIRKKLKNDYNMFGSEMDEAYPKVAGYLNDQAETGFLRLRNRILVKSILEFLNDHQRIDLEGFMNFRSGQYKRELKKQIARAVNVYALQQEHESFVRLLKRFFESQRDNKNTMHMVINHKDEVAFYDDNHSVLINSSAESEDHPISVLLKRSPNRLIVHVAAEKQSGIARIVQEVFGDKMTYCRGCSLCKEN
ncbi:hypothetical protein UNSWDHB_2150 [Dehalobacter sp. UNSWDHB]|uniref:putative sporulation protein YtxC n=1 Tax=unclassified Dehalobacter TaxID=2635733 RepID=UPI00028BB5A9|nr:MULTISPECIES: putative sporulation protein YtxC [unclassified Dehalobacter]AFV03012.1 hypothetical protein DHBDCA_p1985 [Dehalobacter sp. DCA]AFV06000.1 hypothetical protein DCF50_p1997 [Dehalobacter sp. CF]EQB20533.1 hypothetical protein UNSWDHB_2150 [Dehalobacter sp. UNSWDHB]